MWSLGTLLILTLGGLEVLGSVFARPVVTGLPIPSFQGQERPSKDSFVEFPVVPQINDNSFRIHNYLDDTYLKGNMKTM